jgi:hypothetical protein
MYLCCKLKRFVGKYSQKSYVFFIKTLTNNWFGKRVLIKKNLLQREGFPEIHKFIMRL